MSRPLRHDINTVTDTQSVFDFHFLVMLRGSDVTSYRHENCPVSYTDIPVVRRK